MQWASHLPDNCLYASIDDDVIVDHARLITFYKKMMSNYIGSDGKVNFLKIPIVCVYSYQSKDIPSRDPSSKWFVSSEKYSGKYWPVYCRGGLYTISRMATKKIFEASKFVKRLQMDDVWITGIMRKKAEYDDTNLIVRVLIFFL